MIHYLRVLATRLRGVFGGRRADRELDDEIETHLRLLTERYVAQGMTEAEAAWAARRQFGNITLLKGTNREMRGFRFIDTLVQDLRYGMRMLRRNPGFTAVAALTLALGIGANTAIFSVADPILIKSLPVKNPEQLVMLNTINQRGEKDDYFFYSIFEKLRDRTHVFSGIYTADGAGSADMTGTEPGQGAERARLQLVSGEYFQVLGVNAVLGRTLTAADNETPGAHPVAVLSHSFWLRRFAGDGSVMGKVITIKKQPLRIIGVAEPGFFGDEIGESPDIWAPLVMFDWNRSQGSLNKRMMARLRPDVSQAQAQAEMDLFLGQIKADPGSLSNQTSSNVGQNNVAWISKILLVPGSQGFSGFRSWMAQPLWILMGAVILVLLISCANVSNLLLGQAAKRVPEVAIRLAIGAGRFRLVRQFLTESALLAAAGTVLGLFLAWWGCQIILALIKEYDSSIKIDAIELIPNARILTYTMGVTLLATFIIGLAPALIATRQDVNTALKSPVRPRSRFSLARALVIAQVALSLLLLTGTGLFIQTLRNLRTRDLGFDAEHIIQGSMNIRAGGYKAEQLSALFDRVLERLNSMPGVRAASLGGSWGLGGRKSQVCCMTVQGYDHRPNEDRFIPIKFVRPGYFQALGLQLSGRDFNLREIINEPEKSGKVAIINETLARRYFGTVNPVGKRFGWGDSHSATENPLGQRIEAGDSTQFEIIGIVKDAVYGNPREESRPLIYFPGDAGAGFVVRTVGPAASLVPAVSREIQAIDKSLAPTMRTVAQMLDEELFLERLMAKLSAFFGLLALLLASIGLYGVMSNDVTRRTHEIGIRTALGAQRKDVVGLVIRETMILVIIGLVIGLSVALVATPMVAILLYGLTPNDPLTITLASVLLLTVALLAGYLPARRAARVDPMVALRHD